MVSLWRVGRDLKVLPFNLLLSDSFLYSPFPKFLRTYYVTNTITGAMKTEYKSMVLVHEVLTRMRSTDKVQWSRQTGRQEAEMDGAGPLVL